MTETGPSYGEQGDVVYNVFKKAEHSFSGNFYLEKIVFPGSITIKVSIPPWDFYFMVMNSMIKIKSCICKVLLTKRVLQKIGSIEGK